MSRILKVSQSDYRLAVQAGGTITLDTGTSTGTVVITGNLDVKGTTTTVESTNTTIKDNIIQINYGQVGSGISSTLDYQAGIRIGRGSESDAEFLFDETVNHYDPITATTVPGTFVLKTIDGALSGLQVGSIANSGSSNFVFDMQSSAYVLSVANSPAYESYVLDDNDIPNRKYIGDYVAASGGTADVSRIHYPLTGTQRSNVTAGYSSIDFNVTVNSAVVTQAQLSAGNFAVNKISIASDTVTNNSFISNTSGTQNLILTATNNTVEISAVLALDNQGSVPSSSSGKNKIYASSTIGPGATGLYYVNSTVSDELVAKNRALLFSMLF